VDRSPPNIDTGGVPDREKAGFPPAFLFLSASAACARTNFRALKNNFALHATFCHHQLLWFGRLVGQ
jgi:hypothetical protein